MSVPPPPPYNPWDHERLLAWYRSLGRRRRNELHAAIGHNLTPGRAPRLGKVLIWAGLVLAVVVCLPLAIILGLGRGAGFLALPFAGLALLGNYLAYGQVDRRTAGYWLTDDMIIAMWEADQRLNSSR